MSTTGTTPTVAEPLAPTSTPAEVARAFFTAFSNMDYSSLAALTTEDFVFEDVAFPHIEGDVARGMYKWFITDQKRTQMKVIVHDIQPSPTDPNAAIVSFTNDYYFNGTKHILNKITAKLVITDGKVSLEQDSCSFPDWAKQALGPWIGTLLGSFQFTQTRVQAAAKERLDAFLLKNPV
ncbi:hypothetical protein C8J57DRAFT_1359804 [Mycena rebaudengoi]|nr:hypothetical protein C8J57DRAFT_1359804 [Mycena rebaudengoi]